MMNLKDVKKHDFLLYDERRTISLIKRGRTDKTCEHCKLAIPIGMEHKVHMFADYESYPTHLDCSLPFSASLL